MTPDRWEQFENLTLPESGERESFRIEAADSGSPIMLGKDGRGRPAFLVRVGPVAAPRSTTAVELPNLRVRHSCTVNLDLPGRRLKEEELSVVQCRADSAELHRLFISAFSNALPIQGETVKARDLQDLVDHLVELFRSATELAAGDVLGLWGELFVIRASDQTATMIDAWHVHPESRVDFATEQEWVEVKTTSRVERAHDLSFEQANPPSQIRSYVVSVQTEQIDSGTSIGELWQDIEEALDGDLHRLRKLDQLCMRTLGSAWNRAESYRFDRSLAVGRTRVFTTETIPRITFSPPGVTQIRFRSDFSGVAPLSRTELEAVPAPSIVRTLTGLAPN